MKFASISLSAVAILAEASNAEFSTRKKGLRTLSELEPSSKSYSSMSMNVASMQYVVVVNSSGAGTGAGASTGHHSSKSSKSKSAKSAKAVNKLKYFERVSTYAVCNQLHPTCDDDTETVAEIIAVTDDGMTAVYTDAKLEALGFVDVSNPSDPKGIGTFDLDGEPTSVAIKRNYALVCINTSQADPLAIPALTKYENPSGTLVVVDVSDPSHPTFVRGIDLGGQPDSIAVSPDKNYAVVAIENERDEDLGDGYPPQLPAGFVVIVDISAGDPEDWVKNDDIHVTGLGGVRFPDDPEPEFVSINDDNVAVVTLQENNAVVLIDITDGSVVESFSTGDVTLENVDTIEDKEILQVETLANRRREADGVVWIKDGYFVTANEGDLDGGSRGFTIFKDGTVVYESNMTAEHMITSIGHYNDKRSGNKGVEFENVVYAEDLDLVFVISERSSVIMVYDISDPSDVKFHQVLPSCVSPEGGFYVKSTQVLIIACEEDARSEKIRAGLAIYEYGRAKPSYPNLKSVVPDENESTGVPIPWAALSGLSAPAGSYPRNTLYTIDDSAFRKSKIFIIDVSESPAMITKAVQIKDSNDVFASFAPSGEFSPDDLSAMINDDDTVNLDQEGIVAIQDGFWIASEGRGNYGDDPEEEGTRPVESLNFLFKVDMEGVIKEVVSLPDEVNVKQIRFGFEGVTAQGDYLVVAFQRAWDGEVSPRLGFYNLLDESWKFVFYPLDAVESQNGGWVGLSEITSLGDGDFLVLERDNQGGPDAAIKRIYKISLGNLNGIEDGYAVTKTLVHDILGDLSTKIGGLALEKVEGMAVLNKEVWIITDNDAVDGSSGETQLINLGKIV